MQKQKSSRWIRTWSKKTQGEHTNHLATTGLLIGYVVDWLSTKRNLKKWQFCWIESLSAKISFTFVIEVGVLFRFISVSKNFASDTNLMSLVSQMAWLVFKIYIFLQFFHKKLAARRLFSLTVHNYTIKTNEIVKNHTDPYSQGKEWPSAHINKCL